MASSLGNESELFIPLVYWPRVTKLAGLPKHISANIEPQLTEQLASLFT